MAPSCVFEGVLAVATEPTFQNNSQRLRRGLTLLAGIVVFSMASPQRVSGFETDQYTAPPQPLADIGDDVTDKVYGEISNAVKSVNKEIDRNTGHNNPKEWFYATYQKQLQYYQSEDAIVKKVFEALGPGSPATKIESWIARNNFHKKNVLFDPPTKDTIYTMSQKSHFSFFFTLSRLGPTINMFGFSIGADKVGHFSQQGYEYWGVYTRELAKGSSETEAIQRAVQNGITQEEGEYGFQYTGVYSNGDLAANYAGLKFYINLTHEITIGGRRLPPVLVRKGNHWEMNPARSKSTLLRPFISDHLNEAVNPNVYVDRIREEVRTEVQKRRAAWMARHPNATWESETRRFWNIQSWNGETYGFRVDPAQVIMVANTFLKPEPGQQFALLQEKALAADKAGKTSEVSLSLDASQAIPFCNEINLHYQMGAAFLSDLLEKLGPVKAPLMKRNSPKKSNPTN